MVADSRTAPVVGVVRDASSARAVRPGVCKHVDVEFLAGGGSAIYLRCVTCDAVLVRQGGQVWSVRPA